MQEAHQALLADVVPSECTFLDAGCGVGTLYDVLPHDRIAKYIGVDWCSAFITYALLQRPTVDFRLGDLTDLSDFKDGEFDLCVMRGYGSVVSGTWDAIASELRRVAKKVLCLASTVPDHTRWL
jgi:SAM-dependent methyltransferase